MKTAAAAIHCDPRSCLGPAVPGYDLPCVIDQDRIGEAEALNAIRNLAQLLP